MKNLCSVSGCGREISRVKHQLCNTHYQRYYMTGIVGGPEIRKRMILKPYEPNNRVDCRFEKPEV